MTLVSNMTLSRQAQVVFANSSAYHVELRMIGRTAEETTFLSALESGDGPRLLTVRAPLGAGKTFFLNAVLGKFARTSPSFIENRSSHQVLATGFDVPGGDDDGAEVRVEHILDSDRLGEVAAVHEAAFEGSKEPHVLIIEELDRKASLGQILWSIAGGIRWLSSGGNRLLVLTGDATISHERIQELVQSVEQRSHIDLGPLDATLLIDALDARILDKVIEPSGVEASQDAKNRAANEAASRLVADEFVRWAVLPATGSIELATFREALGALRMMCELAPPYDDRVEFKREVVRALRQTSMAPGGPAQRLETALVADLKERIAGSHALAPLTVEELAELAGTEPTPRFRRRAVEAVARLGLLTPLGTPFNEVDDRGTFISLTPPFVPSYRLLHRVLAEMVAEGADASAPRA